MSDAKTARGAIIGGKKNEHWIVVPGNDSLLSPLHWRKPRRIFVNSMSDLFHEAVPFEFIDRVFAVMALTPRHTYQVCTKRPGRMAEYLRTRTDGKGNATDNIGHEMERLTDYTIGIAEHPWPLPNAWLGTSVENQAAADERITHLLRCQAAVRFLSVEPLLGEVDLAPMMYRGTDHAGIQWVIVGGESGSRARPCYVDDIEAIVRQCREADVPVFVKQLGAKPFQSPQCDGGTGYELPITDRKGADPAEWPADLRVRQWPKGYKPTGDSI